MIDTLTYPDKGIIFFGVAKRLISNQNAGQRSWTSYFVGQVRCERNNATCARILADGRIQYTFPFMGSWSPVTSPTPFGMESVTAHFGAGDILAQPTNPDLPRFYGSPPADWEVLYTASSVNGNSAD